eukprot:245064-Hanusia_phi.AAC.1
MSQLQALHCTQRHRQPTGPGRAGQARARREETGRSPGSEGAEASCRRLSAVQKSSSWPS